MNHHASGTFEVKLTPQPLADLTAGPMLGRLSIAKRYVGELDAEATGEMLTAGTEVQGSAVYVAVERVTGRLRGLSGSFALHHTGILERGAAQLSVRVVPDSGTGDLTGLAGAMTITIIGKEHRYALEYTLGSS